MSLSKQLLILISALFLVIFSVNFVLSVNNSRNYLEGEAEVHAQDTATSLGLALSPYLIDQADPMIKATMNAIFDMGYYQEIKLVDSQKQVLVTLTHRQVLDDIPQWFMDMIPMKAATAESEIHSGWIVAGSIYVTINSRYAYLNLYEQAKKSLWYSVLIFITSIGLLLIVLRFTLSSLKRIEHMALNMADGQFETIETLPWTAEVKNVTASMNMMSRKIEGAISNLNVKLEKTGKKLQQDDLTGLKKKSGFATDLKNLDVSNIDAFVFIIKIDGLSDLLKELDNDSIDQFVKDFSQVLTDQSLEYGEGVVSAYRFFGLEFVLLSTELNHQQIEVLAKQLSNAFAEAGKKYNRVDIAHIGVAQVHPFSGMDDVLSAASEAYEQARLIGENSHYIRLGDDQAKDMAEWKELVFDVVDNQKYSISFIAQIASFQTQQLLMEEVSLQVVDQNNDLISTATFISAAERLGKVVDLDKAVILNAIEYISNNSFSHFVAINVSTMTIRSRGFCLWLLDSLKKKPLVSQQLVFSFSAYAVAKDVEGYKDFIALVHTLNAQVMIKRFEAQSMSSKVTKDLKPDFIRLAREIGQGIATDEGKKTFVETMQGIGELLDIKILAENVHAEDDFNCIKAINIVGTSR